MKRNELFGDERVVHAAMSLAKMVKDAGKPVVFDMERYMELVLGHSAPQLGGHLDKYMRGLTNATTDEERRKIKDDLQNLEGAKKIAAQAKRHFVDALSDAFTLDEVHAECPCSVFEIGHTNEYSEGLLLPMESAKTKDEGWLQDEEAEREYAWVFMVVRTPAPNEVSYIPL